MLPPRTITASPTPSQRRPIRPALLTAITLVFVLWSISALGAGQPQAPAVADLPVRLVPAGDVSLACRETGNGPPLVFLTGYACPADVWDADLVAGLAASHHLFLCDYRGMGESTVTDAPFSLELFAKDMATALDSLTAEKADVLGWSMGSMVARKLAALAPQRIGKLVLIGAVNAPATATRSIARMATMSQEDFAASLFPPGWLAEHPDAVAGLPRPATPPDKDIVARQRQAIADATGDGDDTVPIANEVLLVVGDEDWVTPPAESEALAKRLPQSRLVRLPRAGHWLMYQEPVELARTINEFLAGP